ncbi:MAG: hypothetical protein LBK58_06690 [Prevotellaceae bacterium]|jgi:hypothetical protein|nr:hypothetical protein [Prevotellaceae bacterium]
MKKANYLIAVCLGLTVLLGGCDPQRKIAGNYSFKIECMGSELDGSVTVKAWGNGRNYSDALEQAKKNAVYDVMFKGVTEGHGSCSRIPLVAAGNARIAHETYFNNFFRDNGEFLKYVNLQDERYSDKWNRDRRGARQSVTYGIVLRILRSDLKMRLINDGILKQ